MDTTILTAIAAVVLIPVAGLFAALDATELAFGLDEVGATALR